MLAARAVEFKVLLAFPLGKGIVCIGCTQRADDRLLSCSLIRDDGQEQRMRFQQGEAQLIVTAPPSTRGASQSGMGFVLWLPTPGSVPKPDATAPLFTFNDQLGDVEPLLLTFAESLLSEPALLTVAGDAVLGLARHHGDKTLATVLQQALSKLQAERADLMGRIDQAWQLAGHLLVLGRVECPESNLISAEVQDRRGRTLPKPVQLLKTATATAWNAKGQALHSDACHFAVLLKPDKSGNQPVPGSLLLHTHKFGNLPFALEVLIAEPEQLTSIVAQYPALALPLLAALARTFKTAALQQNLQAAALACMLAQASGCGASARFGQHSSLSLLRCHALHEEGLLIVGNYIRPQGTTFRLWLHGLQQPALDLTPLLTFLPVEEPLAELHKHFPEANPDLCFVVRAPLPTFGGEARLLRLVQPGLPDLWVKASTQAAQPRGVAVVKDLLEQLPPSDTLLRFFKPLCDKGLGPALHWLGHSTAQRAEPAVTPFGPPPHKPAVSIIIPLYGRCDFLRHQLAQFCGDPDFKNVDLLYVVDDPNLHTATLQLASHLQPLFGVPFRVLTYPENRGFAGANNTAAALAKAPLLLLMNSDVLPQQHGWLHTLKRALQRLPQCGMVGPLLQFPEGSVQHAGMAAIRQPNKPGLVFNDHPGKGCAWEGGDRSSEHPMLTGACLLLRTQDYLAVGGFDEDYLVGDFEDSDLSLRMRANGKRLYLVPKARLWHLERQSQYLGSAKRGARDMLTLYNAWRYQSKIAAGTLPDPEQIKVGT